MQVHPLANLLPPMSDAEYRSLLESIRANGLREPLVTDAESGELLDGRHRYRACQELGIKPLVKSLAFDSPEARLAFVLDANLHRRHLDESQRAMVAAKIANMRQGERTDMEPCANLRKVSQPEAAEMLNTSRRAVQSATVVQQKGIPELSDSVDSAAVSVSVAEKVARMPEAKQQEFVAQVRDTDKPPHQIVAAMKRDEKRQEITQKALSGELPTDCRYPVIYADPPWRYEQQLMGHTDRGVENHYPTMSLEEICAMPVKELATEDAILFLWVTVPCVKEALAVMEAWGFEYKTQLVWVKDKIGMGFYVRNQHELLFIGRRGDLPLPEPENRPSSYFAAPRGEHSEKPEEFAALIRRMYPGLPAIELFARTARPGWERWGYEAPAEIITSEPTSPALTAFFDPPKTQKRFTVPALSDVRAYMTEIGIPHLAEKWHDYYSSNGWKVGKNPMKDWKASCRTWRDNQKQNPLPAPPKKDERDMTIEDRRQRIRGWLQQGGLSSG